LIFEEQISRKPDRYPFAKRFMEAIQDNLWDVRSFSFASDLHDFKTVLTEQEKQIVVRTLSSISQIEIAVKTFWANLGKNLPHPGLSDVGFTFAYIEVVHNNAYERLLEILGIEDVFESNLKLDVMLNRVNYLKKYNQKIYVDDKKQYVYALTLFTLFTEGVSLFSQFYFVNWFNKFKNVLKDTRQQTRYVTQEEENHRLFGSKLINVIREEHPELFDDELNQRIIHEAKEAYLAEEKIVEWILGDYEDAHISKNILKEFIKNRMNTCLNDIGFSNLFIIDEELLSQSDWFEEENKGMILSDFFHSRPVEYSKNSQSFDQDIIFKHRSIRTSPEENLSSTYSSNMKVE
jgi:ribonucleoside-diphosphate reductase beta chain